MFGLPREWLIFKEGRVRLDDRFQIDRTVGKLLILITPLACVLQISPNNNARHHQQTNTSNVTLNRVRIRASQQLNLPDFLIQNVTKVTEKSKMSQV